MEKLAIREDQPSLDCVWMAYEAANTGVLTSSTLRRNSFFVNHLDSFFRGRPVGSITREDLVRYRLGRIQDGARPEQVNAEVALAVRLIEDAGLIAPRLGALRVERTERGVALSEEQRERIFNVDMGIIMAKGLCEMLCLVRLALSTGMRAGEIRGLTWDEVNWDTREINLRHSKTAAGRRLIPCNDRAMAALYTLRQINPRERICGYRDWDRAWANLKKALDLPGSLRFHDLRHTVITVLYEAGVPEGAIQAIVGHVDPIVTRRYSHFRSEARRQAVGALEPKIQAS